MDAIEFPDEREVMALGEYMMTALRTYNRERPIEIDVVVNAAISVAFTVINDCDCEEQQARMLAACQHFFDNEFTTDKAMVKRFRDTMTAVVAPAKGNA
jgi:hypothetical protein